MRFTKDWFSHNIPNIINTLSKVNDDPINKILEIGSYEGKSTCWFLKNVLSNYGEITCVDEWQPKEDYKDLNDNIYNSFLDNIKECIGPLQNISVIIGNSYDVLGNLISNNKQKYFDLIYVDGSHRACDVLSDMVMSWGLLKDGGIMLMDDYLWSTTNTVRPEHDRPQIAIDSFLACYFNQLEIIHKEYQVHVKKCYLNNT